MGKVNKCPKGIDLLNIFTDFLWDMKKTIDFFDGILYFSWKWY